MLKKILLVGSILLLFFPGVRADDHPTILVVGDSLSAGLGLAPKDGWVNLLQSRLAEQGYEYKVVNASISGDTTRGALARLPRALSVHAPEIVVIELGGNDGLRGFPLATMRENLERIIALSRQAGATVVLLGIRLPDNYGEQYTQRFHAIYLELAEQYDLSLLPWFLEGVAMNPDLMQADGIHPNRAAQPLLLENVWSVLQALL